MGNMRQLPPLRNTYKIPLTTSRKSVGGRRALPCFFLGMFWKIEKEIFGSLPKIQVFIITMGSPFNILQPGRDLPIIGLCLFLKIKPVIFGSLPEVEQAVTMGNLFEILQLKKDFPIMILLLSWKTKPGNYGLAQGATLVFMMENIYCFHK